MSVVYVHEIIIKMKGAKSEHIWETCSKLRCMFLVLFLWHTLKEYMLHVSGTNVLEMIHYWTNYP